MARSRNIKPGFFINEYLGTCDPLEALLFEGLWCLADKEGRLENRPLKIKGQIFPYRNLTTQEISRFIRNLSSNGFLIEYTVDGIAYIEICNFIKHQNPHKNEKAAGIPGPEKAKEKTPIETTGCESSSNYATTPVKNGDAQEILPDSLNLIPDSLQNTGACEKQKADLDEKFNEFWKGLDQWHGKKGNKQEALREFKKINPSDELINKMISGYQDQVRYSDKLKSLNQFSELFKHVCRWLKYRGWEDDVPSLDSVVAIQARAPQISREQSIELANQQAAEAFARGDYQ